jgi:isopentenyl-diphosphate delta-isomerase
MTGPAAAGVELVVLLDESGLAVGTAPKATVHGQDTPLHLAFSCYVFDTAGNLLLTRRASHKPTWPGVWTNSCCGHPGPGEAIEDAARRRVRQELGISLVDLRLVLPGFRYRATMADGTVENEMCPVLVARTGDAVRADPAEVDDVRWVPWLQARDGILVGTLDVSPWCREQVAELPVEPFAGRPADPRRLPPGATVPTVPGAS